MKEKKKKRKSKTEFSIERKNRCVTVLQRCVDRPRRVPFFGFSFVCPTINASLERATETNDNHESISRQIKSTQALNCTVSNDSRNLLRHCRPTRRFDIVMERMEHYIIQVTKKKKKNSNLIAPQLATTNCYTYIVVNILLTIEKEKKKRKKINRLILFCLFRFLSRFWQWRAPRSSVNRGLN